jgi:hypothetical protein
MPYSAQRDLTGKHPLNVFQFLVMADNTGSLYDGTGSQVTSLNVTSSQAISASYEILYELSSSYANFADSSSFALSASWATQSFSASYSISGSRSDTSSFSLFSTSGSHAGFSTSGSYSDFGSSASYSGFSTSGSHAGFSTSGSHAGFSTSGSHAGFSTSGSHSQTSSYISPPFGAVSNVSNATGSSAGAAGFTDAAELGAFILAVSSSFQTLNTLISDLRASGVIT